MVLLADADSLPAADRQQFETSLAALDKPVILSNSLPISKTPRVHTKASPSLLSLQGLGEVLFGGAERADVPNTVAASPAEEEAAAVQAYMRDPLRRNNLPSARWDAGYEGVIDALSSDAASADLLVRGVGHADSSLLLRRSLPGDDLRSVSG